MYKWSIVINFFRWLTVQTTVKIDSIPSNWCCLDYYILKKKWSSFIETYRVFLRAQHIFAVIMNGWNRDVCPSRMHLICWRPCILSFQNFWIDRFNFSRHLINICLKKKPYYWLLHSHFWLSIGNEKNSIILSIILLCLPGTMCCF